MTANRLTAYLIIAIFAMFACLHMAIARERVLAERAQAEAAEKLYEATAGIVRARMLLMNAEAEQIKAMAWRRAR